MTQSGCEVDLDQGEDGLRTRILAPVFLLMALR